MDDKEIFFTLTFGFILFYIFSYYYLLKNRYDLNALYRSNYLMFQEFIVFGIWEQSIFFLAYYNSDILIEIMSCAYIITSNLFSVNYIILWYRLALLHKIEFGKIHSDQYLKWFTRLNSHWSLKLSWIISIIFSSSELFVYLNISHEKSKSIIELLHNGDGFVLNLTVRIIGLIEAMASLHCIWFVIMKKLRLTLKIEVFLVFVIATTNVISELVVEDSKAYSFLLILLGFSLNLILIISFTIRSNFSKIPDPPLVCFDSSFIYEHKLLYNHIYEFLQNLPDKHLLNSLELGIYINMYKEEKKESFLKIIKELCQRCDLPEYSFEFVDEIGEYIRTNNEYIFKCFCKSDYYERFKKSLKIKRNNLFL